MTIKNSREGPSIPDEIHQCREVRISYGPRRKCVAISDSRSAHELAKRIIDPRADREHFAAVFLDARNMPLGWRVISIGTLTGSLVAPREVFRPGIMLGAAAIVVFHNHPSGDCQPSGEDLAVTERLHSVGEILGIRLLDHLILGDGKYHSFADSGDLTR